MRRLMTNGKVSLQHSQRRMDWQPAVFAFGLVTASSLFSDLVQLDFMGALGAHSLGEERNFLRLEKCIFGSGAV